MNWSIDDCSGFEFQSGGPVENARSADAAFELVLFVEAKRSIASPGPTG